MYLSAFITPIDGHISSLAKSMAHKIKRTLNESCYYLIPKYENSHNVLKQNSYYIVLTHFPISFIKRSNISL